MAEASGVVAQFEPVDRVRPVRRPGRAESVKNVSYVYLDEIFDIHALLNRDCESVEMQTDRYKIVNPNQLTEVPQERIDFFLIRTTTPKIEIKFSGTAPSVVTYSDEELSEFLFDEITSIIRRRRSKALDFFESGRGVALFLLAPILPVFLLVSLTLGLDTAPYSVAFCSIGTMVAFLGFSTWAHGQSDRGVIRPCLKKNAAKPWYRSDTFKIAVASSVVASAITGLITWWITTSVNGGR